MDVLDYSSWTVMAILSPAFRGAAHGGQEYVGSGDMLLEYCRRMGGEIPLLKLILKSDFLDSVDRKLDGKEGLGSAHPLSVHEARSILREVAHESADSLTGRHVAVLPTWTAGAVKVLADARSTSEERGIPWVGDREVLTALLMSEGTTASAFLARSGINRSDLLLKVGRLEPFQGKRPWAPAIDSLEMTGVLRVNMMSRFLGWPIHVVSRKVNGRSFGLLSTLEGEATRQAVREGSAGVQAEQVVLGAASIFHQLALSKISEPEELHNSRTVLERYGLSYADLSLRVVHSARSVRSQLNGEPLSVQARPPVASPEVAMAFELLRGLVAQGNSCIQVLESLFAIPQVTAAIAALTADQP
ncbi:hypothetical protein [Micromonospora sp. NPDC047527]|uniref:hypothetical protein n=1 Tax=unclassified Micromonospora TaxID=2617518 RepID=UPI00340EB98A